MISIIQGLILEKEPTRIVIDVQGLGYEVAIPVSTFERTGQVGDSAKLLTHLHVREDILQLYGFSTKEERELFQLLISISGIGPKSAIGIMSGAAINDFKAAVLNEDVQVLTAIPGIGKKTAQRIVIELKDKIAKIADSLPAGSVRPAISVQTQLADEAMMALMSLGYSKMASEKAIARAIKETGGQALSLQEMIKIALRNASLG